MPFVRISLVRGKSMEHIAGISESVHQALMEEFNVPALDKFQVVHEVERHQLVFPSSYLEISHTEDIVYIHITCKEGRTVAMRRTGPSAVARLNLSNKENRGTPHSLIKVMICLDGDRAS